MRGWQPLPGMEDAAATAPAAASSSTTTAAAVRELDVLRAYADLVFDEDCPAPAAPAPVKSNEGGEGEEPPLQQQSSQSLRRAFSLSPPLLLLLLVGLGLCLGF